MQSEHEHHNHTNMKDDEHKHHVSEDQSHEQMSRAEHGTHEMHATHGEHAQHVDHTGHEEIFRQRFWISLLLSIPVLLYTPMLQMWFGFQMPQFSGSQWIPVLFSVIVFLYGGVPFIQMAVPEIRNRQP